LSTPASASGVEILVDAIKEVGGRIYDQQAGEVSSVCSVVDRWNGGLRAKLEAIAAAGQLVISQADIEIAKCKCPEAAAAHIAAVKKAKEALAAALDTLATKVANLDRNIPKFRAECQNQTLLTAKLACLRSGNWLSPVCAAARLLSKDFISDFESLKRNASSIDDAIGAVETSAKTLGAALEFLGKFECPAAAPGGVLDVKNSMFPGP